MLDWKKNIPNYFRKSKIILTRWIPSGVDSFISPCVCAQFKHAAVSPSDIHGAGLRVDPSRRLLPCVSCRGAFLADARRRRRGRPCTVLRPCVYRPVRAWLGSAPRGGGQARGAQQAAWSFRATARASCRHSRRWRRPCTLALRLRLPNPRRKRLLRRQGGYPRGSHN
jgi:hypothetical protein